MLNGGCKKDRPLFGYKTLLHDWKLISVLLIFCVKKTDKNAFFLSSDPSGVWSPSVVWSLTNDSKGMFLISCWSETRQEHYLIN